MRFLIVVLILFLCGIKDAFSQVDAPAALVPPGLNPGDEFFVIFTTSNAERLCHNRVAGDLPSDIRPVDVSEVNNLATTSAATGALTSGVTGWQGLYIHESLNALGAITDTVAASGPAFNNNITQPIYNVLGELIANSRSDLFDGSGAGAGTPLFNDLEVDENGSRANALGTVVYTGFDEFGNKAVSSVDGSTEAVGAGGSGCRAGRASDVDSGWANIGNSANQRRLYVLSPLMRVPALSPTTVPVAPYGFLLILGLLLSYIGGRSKHLKKTLS